MGTKLFVGNINHDATENDLQDHFGAAGKVVSVNIIQDRMTQKPRGFGFVEMGSDAEAKQAITLFHGKEFQGRPLTVNEDGMAARCMQAKNGKNPDISVA